MARRSEGHWAGADILLFTGLPVAAVLYYILSSRWPPAGSGVGWLRGLGGRGGARVLAHQQRRIDQVDPGRLTGEIRDIHRRRPVAPELIVLVHVVQCRQRVGQDELPVAWFSGGLVQPGQVADEDPFEQRAVGAWHAARGPGAAVGRAVIVLVQYPVNDT